MTHGHMVSEQTKRPDLKDFEDRTIDLLKVLNNHIKGYCITKSIENYY